MSRTNHARSSIRGRLTATILGALASALAASAATVTWDNGAGTPKWSDNANWSDDVNGVRNNDTVVFGDTSYAPSEMDKGAAFTNAYLIYQQTNDTVHVLDLKGNTLRISTALRAGYYATAVYDVTTNGYATITNGTLALGSGAAISIGHWNTYVNGYCTGVVTLANNAILSAPSVGNIYVGYGSQGFSQTRGTLDLLAARVSGGSITATELRLGKGTARNSIGYLLIGNDTGLTNLVVTSEFRLGCGVDQHGKGYLGYDNGSGTYVLPTNLSIRIGTSTSSRGNLYLGYGTKINGHGEGRLITTGGGTFTAYLTDLYVGHRSGGSGGQGSIGLLDLRNTTLGAFDIGNGYIGSAVAEPADGLPSTSGKGEVFLPAGSATFGNLTIGSTTNKTYPNTTTRGYLTLSNTVVTITNALSIFKTGWVTSRVDGVSAGLVIVSSDTNNFVMDKSSYGGRMHLVFGSDPGPTLNGYYYALRMGGDNTNLFNTYTNSGAITWDISGLAAKYKAKFGVHTDGSYTYLGVRDVVPQTRGTVFAIR